MYLLTQCTHIQWQMAVVLMNLSQPVFPQFLPPDVLEENP